MSGFEAAYESFLERQRLEATGMRKEMLERDLTGTKKMLEMLWQVFGSFEDLVLEYELISSAGIKIYADVYHRILRIIFEANGYVVHAEKLTREKHSFEQMRVRTYSACKLIHVPFSWDELDKKPEMCVRAIYEIVGRFGNPKSNRWMALSVYEREIIRNAMLHPGSFGRYDTEKWLQLGPEPTRKVLRKLIEKELLVRDGGSGRRFHRFRLSEDAMHLL